MSAWIKTETGEWKEKSITRKNPDWIGKVRIRWDKGDAREQWLSASANNNDNNRSEQLEAGEHPGFTLLS